jgi:menaquinone-dependent protoporphyrinogen oxidase
VPDDMPRFLVAYDTTEGQTRNIAQRVADTVAGAGHDVELNDIRKLPLGFSLDRFDAAIIGASIHLGKHSRRFTEFVAKHRNDLEAIPSAFFSVSLSAAGTEDEKKEAKKYVSELLEQTGWQPKLTATFGGGLLYREYWFLKRWMMKKIARDGGKDTDTTKNHVYTDWDAVDQFVGGFVERLTQP